MSSDYGSDIPVDAFDSDGSADAFDQIVCPPPATPMRKPRVALSELSTNTVITPPASQSHTSPDLCPPPSSQNELRTPARAKTAQQCPTPVTAPKPSQTTKTNRGAYKFDFGKYEGKTIDEVPGSYIGYLKKWPGAANKRPELKAAIVGWDRQRAEEKTQGTWTSGAPSGPSLQDLSPSDLPSFSSSQPTRRLQHTMPIPPSSQLGMMLPPSSSQPTPSRQRATSQNAVPSSQPISWMRPVPSSQPTPSVQPMYSQAPLYPTPQTPQPRALAYPPASQPSPSAQLMTPQTPSTQPAQEGPPLYRFPWGIHKGKTFFEVPEMYFEYLKMQGNLDHMAGLKEALALFEQGMLPIDTKAFQATQPPQPCAVPSLNTPPPSSAPSRPVCMATFAPTSSFPPMSALPMPSPAVSTSPYLSNAPPSSSLPPPSSAPLRLDPPSQNIALSQVGPPPSSAPAPSTAASTSPADYRFNFGKNMGKMISEVPDDYIDYLKEKKIIETRPDLAAALEYFNRIYPPEQRYRLTFGKNKGKSLFEVPPNYIQFLKDNNVANSYVGLQAAMAYYDSRMTRAKPAATKEKAPKKRKRARSPPSSHNRTVRSRWF